MSPSNRHEVTKQARGQDRRRYNNIVYTPGRFVVGIFRLAAEPGTAEVLLARLAAGLQSQLLAGVATSSATDLERGVSPPSFSAIRRLLALCTDCPLAMVALRTRAVDRGMFRFAFGCALRASSLVAADAARVPVCAQALREALVITVSFRARRVRGRSCGRFWPAAVAAWGPCELTAAPGWPARVPRLLLFGPIFLPCGICFSKASTRRPLLTYHRRCQLPSNLPRTAPTFAAVCPSCASLPVSWAVSRLTARRWRRMAGLRLSAGGAGQ